MDFTVDVDPALLEGNVMDPGIIDWDPLPQFETDDMHPGPAPQDIDPYDINLGPHEIDMEAILQEPLMNFDVDNAE